MKNLIILVLCTGFVFSMNISASTNSLQERLEMIHLENQLEALEEKNVELTFNLAVIDFLMKRSQFNIETPADKRKKDSVISGQIVTTVGVTLGAVFLKQYKLAKAIILLGMSGSIYEKYQHLSTDGEYDPLFYSLFYEKFDETYEEYSAFDLDELSQKEKELKDQIQMNLGLMKQYEQRQKGTL